MSLSVSTTLTLAPGAMVRPAEKTQSVYPIDPLTDPRWDVFVASHPGSSIFHSSAWVMALSRTYGYKPIAFTTSGHDQKLRNALLFCKVESWLTGRRLVSVPFSDHCEPLLEADDVPQVFARALEQELQREAWWYIEVRPVGGFTIKTRLNCSQVNYSFHKLDLTPDLDAIFDNFHKNSIQRKIRRADREGLTYEEGTSDVLLDTFYRLFKMTRRRHHLPPPPRKWFRNLIDCFGANLKIRVARKQDRAVAAMITLRHKDTMVYKYGGSDARFHQYGSMHLLFWRAIREAKHLGLQTFDFGRCDAGQDGLITFKNRWGAEESTLTYSRYTAAAKSKHVFDLPAAGWGSRSANRALARLPLGVLSSLGNILYRHVG